MSMKQARVIAARSNKLNVSTEELNQALAKLLLEGTGNVGKDAGGTSSIRWELNRRQTRV